jgi:type IV pilus assembly protein PilX
VNIDFKSGIDRQRGVILIVALIVLVALSLASVGLMRSVDTASSVASNIAIKKDIYRLSPRAVELALAQLAPLRDPASGEFPISDVGGASYFATSNQPVDARGLPLALVNAAAPSEAGVATGWASELALPIPTVGAGGATTNGGFVIRYMAERLCPNPGINDKATNPCRRASPRDTCDAITTACLPPPGTIYTRLTWRIDGPKGAVSYFQSMLL